MYITVQKQNKVKRVSDIYVELKKSETSEKRTEFPLISEVVSCRLWLECVDINLEKVREYS
jgi:hypothetical protein